MVYNITNNEGDAMEIPVFLEPTSTGFRASTQSPVTLSAEGGSESAAVAALNLALQNRLRSGGKIQMMAVQEAKTVLDTFLLDTTSEYTMTKSPMSLLVRET